MNTTRLRVRLLEVQPETIRIVDAPSACTLPELHLLLQAAMGWTASHLHQFLAGPTRWGPVSEDDWDEDQLDESSVTLREMPPAFRYLYDFGDGWEHAIEILGPGAANPGCPEGAGACPPEDCGGPGGYDEFLAAITDSDHQDHDRMLAWSGGAPTFDLAVCDADVRAVAGCVPATVTLVLDLCAGGVKLTPGGRLPRSLVRAVQEQHPGWHHFGSPARVEEDLLPLMILHDLLRTTGLLRLRTGTVHPTRAAGSQAETVRRLRAAFPDGEFRTRLTELVAASLTAAGPQTVTALAARLHPLLGYGWAMGERAVTVADVEAELNRLDYQLQALDIIDVDDHQHPHLWSAGPSARTLLPGAAIIARALEAQPGG